MKEDQLLHIFFLLGRSHKDWEFLEENWEDEYQSATSLTWQDFMVLQDQGWWAYHDAMRSLFDESFRKMSDFEQIRDVFESISADSEDWSDFLELSLETEDFEQVWSLSFLTRDDMKSSLEEYWQNHDDAHSKIMKIRDALRAWFASEEMGRFRAQLIEMIKPLASAIKELSNRNYK